MWYIYFQLSLRFCRKVFLTVELGLQYYRSLRLNLIEKFAQDPHYKVKKLYLIKVLGRTNIIFFQKYNNKALIIR